MGKRDAPRRSVRSVLHQLANSVRALALGSRRSPTEYLTAAPSPQHALDIFKGEFQHVVYPYRYAYERCRDTFYGGARQYANWLTRDDILRALRHFGFHDIEVGHEEEMHIHGPALAIAAGKTAG